MRSLRPLELLVGLSLTGSVLAVALPSFVQNLHASRLAEPMDGLLQIGQRATDRAKLRGLAQAYPESAPLTPSRVPAGVSVQDPPEAWAHPTWKELDFRMEHGHFFSFAFDSRNGREQSSFIATAQGDLDGDGVLSHFSLRGEWRQGEEPVVFPIEIQREVE